MNNLAIQFFSLQHQKTNAQGPFIRPKVSFSTGKGIEVASYCAINLISTGFIINLKRTKTIHF